MPRGFNPVRWFFKERPWKYRPVFIIESECRWAWSIIPYPYWDWSEDMPRTVRVFAPFGKVGIKNVPSSGVHFYDFDSMGLAYRFGPWTFKVGIADND